MDFLEGRSRAGNELVSAVSRGERIPALRLHDLHARGLPTGSFAVRFHPSMQNGMGIISYLKYYSWSERENARILEFARYMGDYLVKDSLTPDTGKFPRFTVRPPARTISAAAGFWHTSRQTFRNRA